ncbi:DNA ligase D [Mesorhizobium sp. L-8-3]|uniref:DNA ligase D n=1 Tax=Mesorhizobium sp. L-8-3 TaxID=2744522 RepID=UPI001928708B|nr:DNA ligase D [Mesorhizobium sp. L-8-3]BCH22385.1 ATP-dependent DNA ligase [Mesorhizobium sp. L-8-3]
MPQRKLKAYRDKRDFSKTSEPVGGVLAGSDNRFVVHKHSATSDHYDLRLQVGDVLKSWAVPRGPSLNPADKRLAVQTEDHPLEYLDFEGLIPEGEYGGGPMIVWDTGTWAPMDDVDRSLTSGAFKFRLAGDKLKGGWMLARLKRRSDEDEDKQNWLLFKEKDLAADETLDILAARPESVKSGRRIEELVEQPKPTPVQVELRPGKPKGAKRGPMPDSLSPQLATAATVPPKDEAKGKDRAGGKTWLHEIKFDGYRTMVRLSEGEARLITRSGLDWTRRYGDLGRAFSVLRCREALIDGEVVALDEQGVSRFAALQDALSQGSAGKLLFYAFDLLYLDGWDLRAVPLLKRKELLTQLLAGQTTSRSAIQLSDHVLGDGEALFEQASDMGLEGIVSKDISAPYQEGRTQSWIKAKAPRPGNFVIVGYTISPATDGLGALALGEWENDELHYRGKVGSGFDAGALRDLEKRLAPLTEGAVPLARAPKETIFVRPVLTARIRYANRTNDGMLRHAVYMGLREAELSREEPTDRIRLVTDADLASIWVTNPTRRLFGKSGPTKLDIAVYYALVGDFMLPHIIGRPVSLFRCPTGRPQDCFFQRHAFNGMPPTVATIRTTNSDDEEKTYISVEDAKGYLALAQFGVVEFHAWGALRQQLEKPDRIVFDLDPGDGVAWREVVEAAIHIRGEMETLGLVPFVKTSGGKGIHVVVPILPKRGWKEVHRATSDIAGRIAASAPETFTAIMGKDNRKRRIFIDFHRNARSATAAAPYSLRARANMPASAPLSWNDLESIDAPEDLNYSSLPGLLTMSGDPWARINEFARELPAASQAKTSSRKQSNN